MDLRRTLCLAAATSTVALALACTKAASEPAPRPNASASSILATSAPSVAMSSDAPTPAKPPKGPVRCILPTPAAPPPPPVPKGPAEACPKDPVKRPETLPIVTLTFPQTPNVKVEAELAVPPDQTERGLMYRTQMPDNHGMLFDLKERRDHTFWMRNTCIPLDLLYIENDGTIVGIVENAPTLSDESRSVGCFSTWVLEMNAGWARKNGIVAGQTIVLPKR